MEQWQNRTIKIVQISIILLYFVICKIKILIVMLLLYENHVHHDVSPVIMTSSYRAGFT